MAPPTTAVPISQPPARHPWRARVAWIAGVSFVLLVGALVVLRVAAPSLIRSKLIGAVQSGCPTCTFTMGDIHLAVLRGHASVDDISFAQGSGPPVTFSLRAQRLDVDLRPLSLLTGTIHLTHAVVTRPVFRIAEDRTITPPEPRIVPPPVLGMPRGIVDGIDVHEGTVVYARVMPGHDPEVRVEHIEGHVNALGTRPDLGLRRLVLHGTGILEGDGRADLRADGDMFSMRGDAVVDMDVRGQTVDHFDDFFGPTEHAHIHGHVEHAHADMRVADGHLTGLITGQYNGLSAHFSTAPNRDAAQTLLTNAGAALLLRHDTGGYSVGINGTRDERKPLTDLLWLSLRDAGQQLVFVVQPPPPAPAPPAEAHGGGPDHAHEHHAHHPHEHHHHHDHDHAH